MANLKAREHVSKQVSDAFSKMDKDGNGYVNMIEFREFCKDVPGMEKLAEAFCEIDTSHDQKVTLDELNTICTEKVPKDKIEECHVADFFRRMDTSGDGRLDKNEFRAMLKDIGYSDSIIERTLEKTCGDDDFVTLEEFLKEWVHEDS